MSMCAKCVPKLEMILSNLRNQNDGAAIHEVNNMRHLAASLIHLFKKGVDNRFVCSETDKLQARSVAFFKKKYAKCKI